MPGSLLTTADVVQCTHAAAATVQSGNSRVLVGGVSAVISSDTHTVAGCPFTVPGPKPQPCASIRWVPATRVLIGGRPAVVQNAGTGQGICQSGEQIPQGPPTIGAIQPRVRGV
jgi:hypothetical protein